ncbi:RICIN domain-containing protein [Kitasatospora sp. NPDC056651]|uniref:RICIN domain-containing protein n=1 Tax=Kitasatospora sp. NPDC056651 TaxID=3345892 RepID=UPI00369DF2E1
MRAITMSPAKRVATAAIAALLLGATPGLATAATTPTPSPAQTPSPVPTPSPVQQPGHWYRYEVLPPNHVVKTLEGSSYGRVITANRQQYNDHQLWSLSGTPGKQLLKNKATGTCLTAPGGSWGGGVTLRTCDRNDVNQQWRTRYWSEGRHTISPAAYPDLYLTGSALIGGPVTVTHRDGTFAQHWATVPAGY